MGKMLNRESIAQSGGDAIGQPASRLNIFVRHP
jgi:hypothetical protein